MDVVLKNTDGVDIPVDIRVVQVLSTSECDVARRQRFPGGAARQAATLKKRQYGSDIVTEGWGTSPF
eukprot:9512394-Prorocentrum_lima.AAC.1